MHGLIPEPVPTAQRHRGGAMNATNLPDVARSILKALLLSLANTGLLSQADADNIIALLGLHDA